MVVMELILDARLWQINLVNDIKNFVFGPAKAPVYGFGRNRKQKFVMSFTIVTVHGLTGRKL